LSAIVPSTILSYSIVADSAETTGLKWATPAATSGPTFMAYLSGGSSQSVSSGVTTKIAMQSEEWDTASCYDTSTYRFTPNVSGYYQFNMCVLGFSSSGTMTLQVQKNGSTWVNGPIEPTNVSTAFRQTMSGIVFLNGTTDYIEPFVTFSAGSPSVGSGTADNTSFSAIWIRS
jgi:hypothetical protein